MAAKENQINWHSYFIYDETSLSGLRWKVNRYHGKKLVKIFRRIGDTVGSATVCRGYRVKLGNSLYFVSRIIFEMHNNYKLKSSDVIDHVDGNKFNNSLTNLRLVNSTLNNRNVKKSVDNTSGVVGVGRQTDKNGCVSWVSTTYNLDGTRTRKCFSENKYGAEEAFRLACQAREILLAELNAEGAGYTERHGQ